MNDMNSSVGIQETGNEVVEWCDGIPTTPDGIPDTATMREMGLGKQASEWDRRMRAVSRLLKLRKTADTGELTDAAERVAAEYEVGTTTLYRWKRILSEGGPVALVPDWGAQKGSTSIPEDLGKQIREFWLNSRQASKAQVYRQVVLPFFEQHNQDPCSYSTVCRFINKSVLPLEETVMRQGIDAWHKKSEPKVVREMPPVGVVWTTDHRMWDVLVVVSDGNGSGWGKHDKMKCPCGSGKERRNCCSLRRPWVTLIADVGSAAFVGWRIGCNPSAAGVCHAVRSAVLNFGVPKWFCPDQGKEFRARRLKGAEVEKYDDAMSSGVWQVLGVEVHPAMPYSAWAKPMESFLSAFSRQWENLCPGWTGRDTDQRPEALERQIRNGSLLSANDFKEVFSEAIKQWNCGHICGDRTCPPMDMYEEHWRATGLPNIPDPNTLSFLLQERREVTIRQEGVVLHAGGQKHRFFDKQLGVFVGCKVRVRWDPERPTVAYIYTPDGNVVAAGRAQKAKWREWGKANRQAKKAARFQKDYVRQRVKQIAGSVPAEQWDPVGAASAVSNRKQEEPPQSDLLSVATAEGHKQNWALGGREKEL